MTNAGVRSSRDWLASTRASAVAWWIPKAAIAAALLAPVPTRAAVWVVALAWMGTACILNAKRCDRTHCRYTGPYYLAMIVPVLVTGSGSVALGFPGWLVLGCVILLGAWLIRWISERAQGRFS